MDPGGPRDTRGAAWVDFDLLFLKITLNEGKKGEHFSEIEWDFECLKG